MEGVLNFDRITSRGGTLEMVVERRDAQIDRKRIFALASRWIFPLRQRFSWEVDSLIGSAEKLLSWGVFVWWCMPCSKDVCTLEIFYEWKCKLGFDDQSLLVLHKCKWGVREVISSSRQQSYGWAQKERS